MSSRDGSTREITWEVVRELMVQLESEYSMTLELVFKAPTMAMDRVQLWVNVRAEPRTLAQQAHRKGFAVCRRFPHPDTRTVEGAAYRALWDIERKLEETAQEVGRASAGQRRMF